MSFELEYPSDAVPLNSPYYVEDAFLKEQIEREIEKPGALIRLRAPKEMGKTSLLLRVLEYANRKNFHTVNVNFKQIDREILSHLHRLLRWLCIAVSEQLNLPARLDDYWDEDIGSKVSCSLYFRQYLFTQIDKPLLLTLDDVDQLFEFESVAKDFFPLLRSWYEEGKKLREWYKLRLFVAHSTDNYVPLNINQSPFNVGLLIKLSDFNAEQVEQLAQRHGLQWQGDGQTQQLMNVIGGHPYFVRLALYHLRHEGIELEPLLATATKPNGIFHHHLRHHLQVLKQKPVLANALKKIVTSSEGISLDSDIAYQLERMGLIKFEEDSWKPLCNLYRAYFFEQILLLETSFNEEIELLKRENEDLKKQITLDRMTGLINLTHFNQELIKEWRRMKRDKKSISIILFDVDNFKLYNDNYGHPQGNTCLQAIAKTIDNSLKRSGDLAARFGGEEFAVLLPDTEEIGAMHLARNIHRAINELNIEHRFNPDNRDIVTLSVGVASLIPSNDNTPEMLVQQADNALYQSKSAGRNCIRLFGLDNNSDVSQ